MTMCARKVRDGVYDIDFGLGKRGDRFRKRIAAARDHIKLPQNGPKRCVRAHTMRTRVNITPSPPVCV